MKNNKVSSSSISLTSESHHTTASFQLQRSCIPSERKNYKSAAMLGLALSLGSSGVLLPMLTKPVRATSLPVAKENTSDLNNSQSGKLFSALNKLKTTLFPPTNLQAVAHNNQTSQAVAIKDLDLSVSLVPKASKISNFIGFNLEDTTDINTVAQLPLAINQIHTVQRGDSLNNIARQYGISRDKLVAANKITNADFIVVNQQLNIPSLQLAQLADSKTLLASNLSILDDRTKFGQWSDTLAESTNNSPETKAIAATETPDLTEKPANLKVIAPQKSPKDPYIKKLRAEIEQLRDRYQAETKNDSSNQREIAQEQNSASAKTSLLDAEAYPIASLNNVDDAAIVNDVEPQKEFISVAPTSGETYTETLEASETEIVTPELPPLASADHYLPTAFDGKYSWPAQGVLTSGYGWRWGRMHKGIDIAAPIGTPIVAAAEGVIISAGWNSGGYGNLVKMKHPDGSISLYAHNNRILVRRGQKVKQGQQIAEMGTTGRSTGPHLHFEIRSNNNAAINPIALLNKR